MHNIIKSIKLMMTKSCISKPKVKCHKYAKTSRKSEIKIENNTEDDTISFFKQEKPKNVSLKKKFSKLFHKSINQSKKMVFTTLLKIKKTL
jgi:hypothetical protein